MWIPQCPAFSQKLSGLPKKWENATYNEEKNPSLQTNLERTKMMKSVDKVFKVISVTVFHMSKKLEERLSVLCGDTEGRKCTSRDKNYM